MPVTFTQPQQGEHHRTWLTEGAEVNKAEPLLSGVSNPISGALFSPLALSLDPCGLNPYSLDTCTLTKYGLKWWLSSYRSSIPSTKIHNLNGFGGSSTSKVYAIFQNLKTNKQKPQNSPNPKHSWSQELQVRDNQPACSCHTWEVLLSGSGKNQG